MPVTNDPTNAARQRDWYARQKAGTTWQPLICQGCGGNHRGKHDPLCSRCQLRLTPEGKASEAERVRRSRAKKRDCDNL